MKKGFILGFLCAALLFTAIGAGAYTLVPSTTKLVLDGVEMKDQALPVLYLEPGYNYIPAALFKKICSTVGTDFNYIGSTDTIEINTKASATATSTGEDITSKTVSSAINQATTDHLESKPTEILSEGMEWVWYEYNGFSDWCISYNYCIYMNEFVISNVGYRITTKLNFDDDGLLNDNMSITNGNTNVPYDSNNIEHAIRANHGVYTNITRLIETINENV
ncbi:MAG: hypothetical protein ABFD25_03320 [Clostridiaceae bacterium]